MNKAKAQLKVYPRTPQAKKKEAGKNVRQDSDKEKKIKENGWSPPCRVGVTRRGNGEPICV